MARRFLFYCAFCLLTIFSLYCQQDSRNGDRKNLKTIVADHITIRGEPKYKSGFTHFDYVNPKAPKGGAITHYATGTYDTFHRYALRGDCVAGWEYFYDTLMVSSEDETEALYPLIAEKIEYAEDYSFIIFYINPAARDQEGRPITAEDAAYSFNIIYEKGVPFFRAYYEGTTATVLDTYRVRFDLPVSGDKDMMIGLCTSTVFPKRFWENYDFSEPIPVPPLGTGPYRVGDYRMGQYVVLERVKDYWAAELPVNKGRYNFDNIRFDYYRDGDVAFEAFKAGEYDFRAENVAKYWATQYTGKLFDSGTIIREEIPHGIPQNMQALTFNVQRPVFSDRRIRIAINYFFDFEWMNKNLFYDQYTRTRSYFQNTEYAAAGLPAPEEIAVLEPIRGLIPAEVFTREYNPPVSDGTGNIRPQMREALVLFNEAGWELRNGKMVSAASGEQMSFELLIYDVSSERLAVPLQRNLARFGIDMKIRMVDTTQFLNRMRSNDYDLIAQGYGAFAYPSTNLNLLWHSDYVDSTYNRAGVQDPALDYLIDGIIASQENAEALLHWGRALDRVLTWNHYVIPQWHISKFRLAYNKKIKRPEILPRYSYGLEGWWIE
ncbi:extracellular solute-binding protein [Treponema sp. OttesenSCG-928-L16]|nr:extracellular solute-binding protein [Treponema sp. OttesenSCG-928-L16]